MKASALFYNNFTIKADVVINQGGTSSGKTYAIMQALFCFAYETPGLIITVVGQDMPNLKAGVLRDALKISKSDEALQRSIRNHNKTNHIFEFHNQSIIEFKSYSDAQDAKSGKRDYLFVNEANGIKWEVYSELALRTSKRVYIDYNPNHEFWVALLQHEVDDIKSKKY